jgi:4-diphosphocytidyl-2-C-methyl-D-erythritol kinase
VFALADGGLSTPKVYAECDRLREATGALVPWPQLNDPLLEALGMGDAYALGANLGNDLQAAALALRPELIPTLDAGSQHGALGAIVSGSGPTCAFLAIDATHARDLAESLTATGAATTTVAAHGPVPGATIV